MSRKPRLAMSLVLVLLVAPTVSRAFGDGEVTVAGSAYTGDFGTGTDIEAQRFTVRYITGNDWQFQAALSVVRMGAASEVTYSGLGPTPMGTRGGRSGADRDGSSGEATTPVETAPETPVALENVWVAGLGDLRLALSRRVLGGGVRVFRVDANVEVKVPTAAEEDNLGTGEWDYRLGWAGEYRFWSCTLYGGLGWNRLGDPSWVDFNNVLDGYVGVDSNPIAGERLILSGWLDGWQEAIDTVGDQAALGVGIRTTGRTRWTLQIRRGLTDASEDLNVILGVAFGVSPGGPGVRGYLW